MKVIILLLSILSYLNVRAQDIILNNEADISNQMSLVNVNYIIDKCLDLNGKSVEIPIGCTMVFREGLIKNGTLIGNMTKIVYQGIVFSNIKIKGTWNIPVIHSTMFQNYNDVDVIKNLIALSDNSISNTIFIHYGKYYVTSPANTKGALCLKGKTNLILNGTIKLIPNNYKGSSVISVKGVSDIKISGGGSIIGDKNSHTGKDGEWGMGIQIMSSKNIRIEGLDIENCWGDCIYIGGNSCNVNIVSCNLHNARRQGISVTHAFNCKIDKCRIYDIAGTPPEYGIDFEPNANSAVHYMNVSDTEIYNCKGGIIAGIKGITAENASVGDIIINHCYVHDLRTNNTFRWHNCNNITIRGCIIDKPQKDCTFMVDAKNVKYRNIEIIK